MLLMNSSVWISSVLAGLVTWIFMYLDAKLFDMPRSKFSYFKGIVFVSGLVGLVVYFLTGKEMSPTLATQSVMPMSGQYGGMGMGEEILTGMPPF